MKIKKGFIMRELAGKAFVIAVGEASKNFNGTITLNEMGKFIWRLIEEGKDKDEIVNGILTEYEEERSVVEADVNSFIEGLKSQNVIE